ncbi:TetR/AcrR family transcriptional regulator [Chloroflexota bacterium]
MKTYHHGDLKNALIQAGIEILSDEGVKGLSLRQVAKRAGVSHTAPYAHFADKQALVAAISTEGYRRLYAQLSLLDQEYASDPLGKLVEVAWSYIQFAVNDPAHFKITFSGVIEKEKDYPSFIEISQQSFNFIIDMVADCQAEGILRPGPTDLIAVHIWGAIHGLATLLIEDQLSSSVLKTYTIREMVISTLNVLTEIEIDPAI